MKLLIFGLFVGLFLSCNWSQTEEPSLSDEKLARIMADMAIAEAATLGLAGYPKDSLMKVYFTQVFEIHGTTPEMYEKDLRLVGKDLPRLREIVDKSTELLGTETKPEPAE